MPVPSFSSSRLAAFGLWIVLALAPAWTSASAQIPQTDFATWLEAVKLEAKQAGISQPTIAAALDGAQLIPRVIELDRKQPEFTQTFWRYVDRRVTADRITRGRELLAKHRSLFAEIEARYHIQPRFLVAFWGLESNFGDYQGDFPVVDGLVSLAYDERRGEFFRAQLLDALRILDRGDIKLAQMKGSWAGAMGQVQFIPSTFISFAVDHDGNGRRDIWNSLPDVFASASNYLKGLNWKGDETWGREVRLPANFDWDLAALNKTKTIAEWQALGVRRSNGNDLPVTDIAGSIVLPGGHKGPAFLVYQNFHSILGWNRSILYAIAVGHLADRLVGLGPLVAARPAEEQPLSRSDVETMQALLGQLGFDTGEPDGVVGRQTRAALKDFQRQSNLPADGYPTAELLDNLRQAAAR